ncbi:MAG: membrane integrity-associated transporter subunit PqiC [Syntrophobacteraceae bacterium]
MGRRLSWTMLLLLFVITAPGCGTSEKPKFYLLRPMVEQSAPVGDLSGSASVIGLGPINLPEYLNRPQIVTTSGTSELELADFHRWAEPLEQNFSRTLAENLSAQLPESRVVLYPWDRSTAVQCQVKINVLNFSGESSRRALLDTRWTIVKAGKVIVEKHSVFEQPLKSAEVEELVLAQSRTLADLSKAIAEAIRTE